MEAHRVRFASKFHKGLILASMAMGVIAEHVFPKVAIGAVEMRKFKKG